MKEKAIDEMVSRVNDMFTNPEFDRKRKEATMELLQLLGQLILEHPEQRFSQILQNYGFVIWDDSDIESNSWSNEFYLEPVTLLKRVKERINDKNSS